MKRIVLILLCILIFWFCAILNAGTRTVPLPEILNPDIFKIDSDIMVVAQKALISIYALPDFKIIKTFGKEGEGPEEFRLLPVGSGLEIDIFPETIVVNSIGKISYFTRDGKYIKEKKIDTLGRMNPFGEKFVGSSLKINQDSKGFKREFILYDRMGNKIREICSHDLPLLQGTGSVSLLDMLSQIIPEYRISGDLIYVSGKQAFEIGIYDRDGCLLNSIKSNEPGVKLSAEGKDRLWKVYQNHPLYKLFWDNIKNAIKLPDYLPPFKTFLVSDGHVYVQTFSQNGAGTRFLVFNPRGNYLKTITLPLVYRDMVTPFMYSISNGRLYQLVEDEAGEEWTLRISDMR
jgi:hypothetical protein